MPSQEDVIRRYVEATSAPDGEAAAALTAEDAVIVLPNGAALVGREGAREFAAKHAESGGRKQTVELTSIDRVAPDRFVLTLVMSSREVETDELLYSMEVGSLIELDDGLITRHGVFPSPEEAAAASDDVETDGLLEFGRSYTAAWCSRDPARVAEHFAPDGSLTINDAEPAVGRTAIGEAANAFMVAFPDLELVMDDLRVQPGSTTYHWTFSGTNGGPDGTGNRVRFSGFEAWTLAADGLIARSLGSFDQAEYDHQVEHGIAEPAG